MTSFLCNMVRSSVEVETNIVSAERVIEYTQIDQEVCKYKYLFIKLKYMFLQTVDNQR